MANDRFNLQIEQDRSISEKVCETLRRSIILKILKPGERLVEAKIAKEMNVSITPVRHAFSQLAKEGLINVFPFRGTYVVEITPKFVEEVLSVRLLLETKAAELAAPRLSRQDCDQLERYALDMENVYRDTGSIHESNKLDVLFHELFFERSDHRLLREMWELLKPRILLLQSYGRVDPIPKGRMVERHMKIVVAARTGQEEALRLAVREHIESGGKLIEIPEG